MKRFVYLSIILLSFVRVCALEKQQQQTPSDTITKEWIQKNYEKREVDIMMRDGVKLRTVIYAPTGNSVRRPIIMQRTCYSSAPYGKEFMPLERAAWREFARNYYIFVFQDVRGKNMSGGVFADIRPFVEGKKTPKFTKDGIIAKPDAQVPIDEASDTYDTAEWLVHNTFCNGNIGVFGISYPGFYSTMAALSGHPAIKAVSPQAPVTDWFVGDDAHHNGAFFIADMFSFQYWFEYLNTPEFHNAYYTGITPASKGVNPTDIVKRDLYNDYLRVGAVKNFTQLLGDSVVGWNEMIEHPDMDEWWEQRNVLHHCKGVKPAVMVVGGLFDAEDCYGAFATYKQIKRDSPKTELYLVEGPWSHGGWGRGATAFFGDVYYGSEQASDYYLKNIEYPFFAYYLEGKGEKPHKVRVFDSGSAVWHNYTETWPLASEKTPLYLTEDGLLGNNVMKIQRPVEYVSDPAHPVPFTMKPYESRPVTYMIEDQRFASTRPDVAVFASSVLADTLQLSGELEVELDVAITGTDADFIVKLIDVFPDNFQYSAEVMKQKHADYANMSGYQMLVRGEVMRGKYRNSYSSPEPFVPGERTKVRFAMPDVAHTYLPGHSIMVQVQSTWFPLVDRNPQKFCNIYTCDDSDFQKATIIIYPESKIMLPVLNAK